MAAATLKAAEAAGVTVHVEGAHLVLEALRRPPPAILQALSQSKAGIISFLRGSDSWSAEDWRAFFVERASIAEFDGGLGRRDAEIQAFECCVTQWRIRNPDGGAAEGIAALSGMGINSRPSPEDFGKSGGH